MENNELEMMNLDKKISEELIEKQRIEFEKKLAYLNYLKKENGSSASMSYVAKLLTNREPKEEYKAEFKIMENLHDIIRLESQENDDITESDFDDLLK